MAQRIAAAELNVGTCPPCRRPQRRIGSEGVPAGEEARGGEEDEGRKMEDFSTVKKNGHGDHLIGPKKKTAESIIPETDSAPKTIGRAVEYARTVDALAEASPTIKRKILSGEIAQPRYPSWRSPRSR